jgi:hypothetical protein
MRVVDGFMTHDVGVDLPSLVVVGRLRINIEQREIHLCAEFVDMVAAR